ncbi:MAG TPA: hypothetical protein PKN11_05590, partial [Anaerolineaceae bacterium]|nr:hypothetical protein [Anaerolineaceae bacterium]
VSQGFQRGCHALGIGNVHLAAFGPNMIFHVRYYNAFAAVFPPALPPPGFYNIFTKFIPFSNVRAR